MDLMPALNVDLGDPIFIGSFWGFILALPISLFLAFWLSAVKNNVAVIFGAFVGTLLGFLILLSWAGTLIFATPLKGANGGALFFGSVLFCSVLGLSGGILTDLLIAGKNRKDYLRSHSQEHQS